MPTYQYLCSNCPHTFEESEKITAEPQSRCPKCDQNSLRRGPGGGFAVSFKGTGFYATDYNNSSCTDKQEVATSKKAHCGCGQGSCN